MWDLRKPGWVDRKCLCLNSVQKNQILSNSGNSQGRSINLDYTICEGSGLIHEGEWGYTQTFNNPNTNKNSTYV